MPGLAAGAVAAIGDNTIDEYLGASAYSFVGGNAVNVGVQARLLGHPVLYLGAVGPDGAGERIRRTLAGRGVDVAGLVVVPGVTSVSRIRVDESGDRHFEYEDFGVCAGYVPDAEQLERVARCGAAHIGMLPPASAAVVRSALAGRGVLVSQDCGVSSGYDHLDIAFCSESAVAAAGGGGTARGADSGGGTARGADSGGGTARGADSGGGTARGADSGGGTARSGDAGRADSRGGTACSAGAGGADAGRARRIAADAVAMGAQLAVVTRGVAGSVAYDGRRWWRAGAVAAEVVDTTGAGDSFIAGFLTARLDGADVDQAMAAGAAVAARTCGHLGAWPQEPVGALG